MDKKIFSSLLRTVPEGQTGQRKGKKHPSNLLKKTK